MVTAWGTLGSIAAAAARVPAPTALATAATARNRRRVGSRGGNIIGWSSADVFVGGVLSTQVALDMGNPAPCSGLEPGRKCQASPRLVFRLNQYSQMSIKAKPKKRGRPATGRDPMMGFRAAPVLRASIVKWA